LQIFKTLFCEIGRDKNEISRIFKALSLNLTCFLQLIDYGTLKLPIEELEDLQISPNVRHVTTDNAELMEQYLQKHSDSSNLSYVGQKASSSTREPRQADGGAWQSYFHSLFDRLQSGHHYRHEETREATSRSDSDSINAARKFFQERFAEGMHPMNYDDENDETVVSRETILLGNGPNGASADAVIERRDIYRDKRQVTDEQIRYVHEHIRSYRLETILNRDQANYIEEELSYLAQKDPEFFRRHFGDTEFKWKRQQKEKSEQEIETIKIIPLDTRPTTQASSRMETGSISVTLTSQPSEIYSDNDETVRLSSGQITPTPTVEFRPFPESSEHKESHRSLKDEGYPTRLLLYEDQMPEKPLVVVLERYPYEWWYDELRHRRDEQDLTLGQRIEKESLGRGIEKESLGQKIDKESLGQKIDKESGLGQEIESTLSQRFEEQSGLGQEMESTLGQRFEEQSLGQEMESTLGQRISEFSTLGQRFEEKSLGQEMESTLGQRIEKESLGQEIDTEALGQEMESTLGQRISEHSGLGQSSDIALREADLTELEEQKRISETSQISIEHVYEQTIEKSPKIRRKVEERDLGQQLETSTTFEEPTVYVTQQEIKFEPIEVKDDYRHSREEGSTHYEFEYEDTIEKSPKIRRNLKEERDLGQQLETSTTFEEPTVYVTQQEIKFEPIEVKDTIEKSPKMRRKVEETSLGQQLETSTTFEEPTVYVTQQDIKFEPIEVKDDYRHSREEGSTHYEFEYEDTIEKSPKIRRNIKEDPDLGRVPQN
jgi:hypothetical protein